MTNKKPTEISKARELGREKALKSFRSRTPRLNDITVNTGMYFAGERRVLKTKVKLNSFNKTTAWLKTNVDIANVYIALDKDKECVSGKRRIAHLKKVRKLLKQEIKSNKTQGLPDTVQALKPKDVALLHKIVQRSQNKVRDLMFEIQFYGVGTGVDGSLVKLRAELLAETKILVLFTEFLNESLKVKAEPKVKKTAVKGKSEEAEKPAKTTKK